MNNQLLALYLCQIGHCNRKLQYCRQIIGQNMNFTPEFIFNSACSSTLHSLDQQNFNDLLKLLGIMLPQKIQNIIFSYFDCKKKSYITQQNFCQFLLPRSRKALVKAISKRNIEDLELSASLKCAFGRFIQQIIINDQMLKVFDKTNWIEINQPKEIKNSQELRMENVRDFLNGNGKYPTNKEIQSIYEQIMNSENYSISKEALQQFIVTFIEKTNRKNIEMQYSQRLYHLKQSYQTNKTMHKMNIQNSNHVSLVRNQCGEELQGVKTLINSNQLNQKRKKIEHNFSSQSERIEQKSKSPYPLSHKKTNSIIQVSGSIDEQNIEQLKTLQKGNKQMKNELQFNQNQNSRRIKHLKYLLKTDGSPI